MCTRPIEQDGNIFACRTCDECISTRRTGWVARAMAEKAMHNHALCVALTYDEDTQENRDAARMFQYADVRAFLARIRSDLRRRYGAGNYALRFLCAGEQGSRDDRCHWHLILYSDRDLLTCGVISKFGQPVTDPDDIFTVGRTKLRRHWTMWGKGFVTFQKPDQGGMNYVLSYCLKDQFTGENSQGTMREAKSENFATGLFRMSKRPPIGVTWLMQKLAALDEFHSVLPSTQLKIPDMGGYWHPHGTMRETLLWTLVALNQRSIWATGANAPQWSSLLASCKDSEKDMEILNGKKIEEDEQSIEDELRQRSRENADRQRRREIVRRCSKKIPCRSCLNGISLRDLERLGVRRVDPGDGGPWEYTSLPGHADIWDRWYDPHPVFRGGGLNPWCAQKGTAEYQRIFPSSGTS